MASITGDKLNILDQATFQKIRASTNEATPTTQRLIRNSKFKKTRSEFCLLNFVKPKPKQNHKRKNYNASSTVKKPLTGKCGKKREVGRKKKHTRLKRSILHFRQKQRLQEQLQLSEQALQNLSLENPQSEHKNVEVLTPKEQTNIHSRRFREYCDNCTTTHLGELVEKLLRELNRFQKRAFSQNEIKARAHRRFVVGFREVLSFLPIRKIKLVIIAPDCEVCTEKDGLDEQISNIKAQCRDLDIPYVFSLKRRKLAYTLCIKGSVSCVGVFDYDGAREIYLDLIAELQQARVLYKQMTIAQN